MHDSEALQPRLLIVEDEPKIARLVADYLEGSGYTTQHIDHGDQVLPWLQQQSADEQLPALVLLDLMLPGTDGLTLCREIRQRWPGVAIIMLTAKVDEVDRLIGLELGADDYICKPFSPREVVARVKALHRRLGTSQLEATTDFSLDESRLAVNYQGQRVELTTVEFALIKSLAERPGHIRNRQQLMDSIYQDNRIVSDRTVDSHIKKVRRKLADVFPEVQFIHSIYGAGYRFEITSEE